MQAAGQQATVTVNGPLAAGQDFEARIQWPHGIIAGAPAGWQVYDDQWRPRVTLALGLISALIGVGGSLFWLLGWYRKGRDPDPCRGTVSSAGEEVHPVPLGGAVVGDGVLEGPVDGLHQRTRQVRPQRVQERQRLVLDRLERLLAAATRERRAPGGQEE